MDTTKFSPFTQPSLSTNPLRSGSGHWIGHVPFAMDLVAEFRPKVIVELGTHLGESYFAFCQQVKAQGLECLCYAVDNWHGDAHMGEFSGSVFESVDAHNRANYASFSYLLRTDFGKAAEQFSTESIDLLHIDGYHTYDAVKNDFDTWSPKVREGGIILFHDVSGRHQDFGVWKFWEEKTKEFPTFYFHHSWGLGVLFKGKNPGNSPLLQTLFGKDPAAQNEIRKYYAFAGERVLAQRQVRLLELEKAQLLNDLQSAKQRFLELESIYANQTRELEHVRHTWLNAPRLKRLWNRMHQFAGRRAAALPA